MVEESESGVTAVDLTMRRATLDAIPIAPLLAAPLAVRDAVAEDAAALATASFQVHEDTPGSGWVRWVGTDPERRREGFARTLVIGVLGLAARAGCRDVRLGTRTDRLAAIRLYLELGFEALGAMAVPRGEGRDDGV